LVPLAALAIAFLKVALYGSVAAVACLGAPHRRRSAPMISEQDFADIVSLLQFMPGPNIVGIAVCVGQKYVDRSGNRRVAGFLLDTLDNRVHAWCAVPPARSSSCPSNILGGVSAAAAGLLIATGIRMLLPHRGGLQAYSLPRSPSA